MSEDQDLSINQSSLLFKCEACHEIFPTRNKLYRHLESHSIITPTKLKKIVLLIGWLVKHISSCEDYHYHYYYYYYSYYYNH